MSTQTQTTQTAVVAKAGVTPADTPVQVTPGAIEAIRVASAKREKRPTGLRVGIRGGGCTGFSYLFEWSDDEPRAQDTVLSFDDGQGGVTRVFIDPKSLVFLRGSTLDYARTLMQRGFKWINPNAKGNCGCGESVQF